MLICFSICTNWENINDLINQMLGIGFALLHLFDLCPNNAGFSDHDG